MRCYDHIAEIMVVMMMTMIMLMKMSVIVVKMVVLVVVAVLIAVVALLREGYVEGGMDDGDGSGCALLRKTTLML